MNNQNEFHSFLTSDEKEANKNNTRNISMETLCLDIKERCPLFAKFLHKICNNHGP